MKLQAYSLCGFVVVVLVLCGEVAWGWRAFKVIFTSFPHQFNADLLAVKVEILNNTGEPTLNLVLTFNEDIDNVYLKYAIALEVNEGNYTELLNRSVNFCKFLKQHSMEPFLRIVYEDLLRQGDFIKKCPIKKGTYTLREYHIDEDLLPSYVPEISFFTDMKLTTANGQELFGGRLNGKIDKSKGFNNLKMFSLG